MAPAVYRRHGRAWLYWFRLVPHLRSEGYWCVAFREEREGGRYRRSRPTRGVERCCQTPGLVHLSARTDLRGRGR